MISTQATAERHTNVGVLSLPGPDSSISRPIKEPRRPLQTLLGRFVETLEIGQQTLADDRLDLRTRMTEANKLLPTINFVLSRTKGQSGSDLAETQRQHASIIGAVVAIATFRDECHDALVRHESEKRAIKSDLARQGIGKSARKRAILELDETRPPIKARELHRMKSSLAYYMKRTQALNLTR